MNDQPKIDFECLQQSKEHASLVMEWRNDPETLKASLTFTEPKTLEAFYPLFLERYFTLANLPSLFALWQGQRIAALRFDPGDDPTDVNRKCAEISINVAPNFRGKGLGTAILRQVAVFAKNQGYDSLFARIKSGNSSSISAFESAGYNFVRQYFWPQDKKVLIYEYVLELTPLKKRKVFITAEAGSNWRAGNAKSDLDRAYALIDAAKEAKADAVKFQLFRKEDLYVRNAGVSDYLSESGIHEDMYSLFKEIEMPYEMVPLLAEHCKKIGIQFLASAFSPKDFAVIDPFVSMHKLASAEISHIHLIECAAKSHKPLIISTGASEIEEIRWAVNTFKKLGGRDLILMQCTAKYPAPPQAMHLRVIPWLKRTFQVPIGLSDHSLNPFNAPLAAVTLGAEFIEKHFTLDKTLKGPDHAFSLDPIELKQMVSCIRELELMLGSSLKKVRPEEEELYLFLRRGIQALQDIRPGDKLIEGKNMAILRPGKQTRGEHPKRLKEVEGKVARNFIAAGSGIHLNDLEH